MHRTTLIAAAVTIAACLTTQTVEGQSGRVARRPAPAAQRATGFMVGVHTIAAPGVAISGEDVRDDFHTELGGGIGAMVGYEFTPTLSVYGSLDLAKQGSGMSDLQGSFGLVHVELGARANLPMGSPRTIPYVTLGVGRRSLGAHIVDHGFDEEYEASFSGSMLAFGGGVQHFLSPATALEAGLSLGIGSFSTLEIDGDADPVHVTRSSSVRLRFGIVWRP